MRVILLVAKSSLKTLILATITFEKNGQLPHLCHATGGLGKVFELLVECFQVHGEGIF